MVTMLEQQFRIKYSEIMENFQCIEYDLKRIYSAMSADDFDEEYDKFKPEGFQFSTFTPDKFEPEKIDMTFLRRGVIGINEIGFIE